MPTLMRFHFLLELGISLCQGHYVSELITALKHLTVRRDISRKLLSSLHFVKGISYQKTQDRDVVKKMYKFWGCVYIKKKATALCLLRAN